MLQMVKTKKREAISDVGFPQRLYPHEYDSAAEIRIKQECLLMNDPTGHIHETDEIQSRAICFDASRMVLDLEQGLSVKIRMDQIKTIFRMGNG